MNTTENATTVKLWFEPTIEETTLRMQTYVQVIPLKLKISAPPPDARVMPHIPELVDAEDSADMSKSSEDSATSFEASLRQWMKALFRSVF